jgi:hypothetical protein
MGAHTYLSCWIMYMTIKLQIVFIYFVQLYIVSIDYLHEKAL